MCTIFQNLAECTTHTKGVVTCIMKGIPCTTSYMYIQAHVVSRGTKSVLWGKPEQAVQHSFTVAKVSLPHLHIYKLYIILKVVESLQFVHIMYVKYMYKIYIHIWRELLWNHSYCGACLGSPNYSCTCSL